MLTDYRPEARPTAVALRSSQIREVANAGMGKPGLLPFWFGEPDEATPPYIRQAAVQAIQEGDTFYVQTLGMPVLRERLSAYLTALHGAIGQDRIAISSSGTSALAVAMQALVGPGDRVVAVTPLWPNLVEMPKVLGAQVHTVALDFTARGWALDLQKLLDALTPDTRALLVNAPNNPTGWCMTASEQKALLEHCRARGIWIVSDDVYERLYYQDNCAPSFLDLTDEQDRHVSCNSFSKAWLMTGWRLGWVVAPPALLPEIGKLIEFSTTCAPPFVQRAGVAALTQGETTIAHTVARLRRGRDHLRAALASVPGIEQAAAAPGAMYNFFRIEGVRDSLDFCKRLVAETGLGLAPGIAFGPEGEGYLRWCYASSPERIDDAIVRLAGFLANARLPH